MKREEIPYSVGDRVRYRGRDIYGRVSPGDTGVVKFIEDGIFPGDFYVGFRTDDGQNATMFSWRLEPI